MQPRTSALGLLNAIQPLTQSDNTIETARAELALFFSTLNTTHPSPLTPEKKTKLHENVSTLRTYLLTQLLDIEKTKTENPSYTNIYNTLILLAQCFPLNKKNEHNQILMTSSNEAVKIPIDNKNRFIAANGYWYRVPNIDYEKTFEENQIDAYLPEKKWAHASNISQQDINRTTLLTSQWPKTSYKSQDDVTLSMMIGTGMGLMTVVILLLVIIVSSGGVALAGIGIGILGLIVGGIIQGANIGMAVNTTAGLIRDYFKNKKINHIDVSDFSHEENKINSLLYMSNTETKLPIASKAEAQKPYFSFAFKRSLINRGSIGMVIGAVIGIVATAAILVFAGPAALPAIALFAILFGPSIGLPFVFGIERVVSHSVSFVKEKFTKPSVVETNDAPQQPSQTKTVTPDLSNTHLKTLEQLSPTNTVYPVIKKTKQDIVNIAFSKLIRNSSYEKQAAELHKKICSLIMQIKNPQRVFADGSETFSYVTVHAAYLSAKENIEGKIKKITSPEKKNVFLNKIEDAFLARKNLICNSVSKNTPTKTQLFFSDTNLEKADKTTQSQPAKPNPMEP